MDCFSCFALMQTFLSSQRGPKDEDLMELLSFPTEQGGGWFRFPFRSPNTLQASQLETAFHGTHMECLHGLMATGRIMPSNDKVAGIRHCEECTSTNRLTSTWLRATLHSSGTTRSTCIYESFVKWRLIQLVRSREGRRPIS